MLKSIFSVLIMGMVGLLVFAIALPDQANQVAQSVLGKAVSLDQVSVVTSAPVQAISDAVSSVFTKKGSDIAASDTTPAAKDTSPLSVENIIDATNNERIKAGLPPLKTNTKLETSAKIKVNDMITNQYFEHTSPSGKTVADLGSEVGYDYVVMGENLALGDFTSASDLLQAWMNSPGHRANILNTSYQDIGVYAAQGTYQGQTVWFAVQHFGTERGVCPAISSSLKTTINTLDGVIKKEESDITTLRSQIEAPDHATDQSYSVLINQFNALVAQYNANVTTSQKEIAQYNAQVNTFNKCLATYQVSKE